MGKQIRLHFVQSILPSVALVQIHPFVPFTPLLQPQVYKAPDIVQVTFCKMTVIVLLLYNKKKSEYFTVIIIKHLV